ncbi:DUF2339 domain-containing protein [Kiritimatiellota bacterium B12222]|nr:DUF2339 domain-containing protein [Kiritimatiellota bacterium B12222]
MNDVEKFMLGCWVVLVTMVYPLFLFKRMKEMRDQLRRLNDKVSASIHVQRRKEEERECKETSASAPEHRSVDQESESVLSQPAPTSVEPLFEVRPAIKSVKREEAVKKDIEWGPDFDLDTEPVVVPPPLPVTSAPPPPSPPRPQVLIPSPVHEAPGAFEVAAKGLMARIWNWIVVGEEYRKPGVSVEFAIATNWLVRVGVLVLVVGVGFFLDYSAKMGWLGDLGKVLLSVGVGGALTGWGMLNLNKKYHLLGQGLIGAGLAILYTSMYAAHQRYDLISSPAAFAAMFMVTGAAAAISVRSRSMLIAILGLIGGYLTPLLLPGAGDPVALFSYLALLGGGVLMISLRRQWFLLNVLAFFFTTLHVSNVLMFWQGARVFTRFMPFLVIFFLLFSTAAFLFQVVQKEKSTWLDLAFMLLNAGVFFVSASVVILDEFRHEWVAAVTISLAVFYGLHFVVLMKRKGGDRGLALCFLSLMSFFCLITVPILFSTDYWSLSWSLMALVFLIASQKVNSRFLEQVGFGLFTVSIFRFLQNDLASAYSSVLYSNMPMTDFLKALVERLVQLGVPLCSLVGALWLQNYPLQTWPEFQVKTENDSGSILHVDFNRWILRVALLVMGFITMNLEVTRSFGYLCEPLVPSLLTLVWVGAGWILFSWLRQHSRSEPLQFLVVLFAAALMLKWLLVDVNGWGFDFRDFRYHPYSFLDAGMRFLDAGMRTAFLLYGFRYFKKKGPESYGLLFGYAALGYFWMYSTFEVNSILGRYVPGLASGGLSVFWGLFALCLVSVGLLKRYRPLRIMGLVMFVWVALKVFFHDLASLDPLYKIVAFILLGVVLLLGAYVYMRFQDRFNLGKGPEDGKEAS